MPSSTQGSVENCKYLSVSIESQTLTTNDLPNSKNINRIVIVTEKGERIIDTLIAP
jgi:hypothetical protein